MGVNIHKYAGVLAFDFYGFLIMGGYDAVLMSSGKDHS